MQTSVIEFYCENELIARVNSEMVLRVGHLINIRLKAYKVVHISFAIDYSENPLKTILRENVELLPI